MKAMIVEAKPIGSEYGLTTEKSYSDISEVHYNVGLRVVVLTAPRGSLQTLWLEHYWPQPRGFRLLDEMDMRGFDCKAFGSDHHLYEIIKGGWFDQERQFPGMLSVEYEDKEWLVKTRNKWISVIDNEAPMVRELRRR
jgi:hypothetical protein